jgi:hypothetical protein
MIPRHTTSCVVLSSTFSNSCDHDHSYNYNNIAATILRYNAPKFSFKAFSFSASPLFLKNKIKSFSDYYLATGFLLYGSTIGYSEQPVDASLHLGRHQLVKPSLLRLSGTLLVPLVGSYQLLSYTPLLPHYPLNLRPS